MTTVQVQGHSPCAGSGAVQSCRTWRSKESVTMRLGRRLEKELRKMLRVWSRSATEGYKSVLTIRTANETPRGRGPYYTWLRKR